MYKEPLRSNDIRQRNEKLVLHLVHLHKEISQSEVVNETGLKASTILRIFKDLENKNLIKPLNSDKGMQRKKKGRKPAYFGPEPTAKYAIGVDFYIGSVSIIVLDFIGELVYRQTVQCERDIDADEVADLLVKLVRETIQQANIPGEKILGIGVGFPGVIDLERGCILHLSGIRGMRNYDLRGRIEGELDIPVLILNNSSLITLSEFRYGRVSKATSVLSILIRTGVGGSFIHDGKLFINRNHSAFEIGHLSLDREGRQCVCGAKGCLETYLSEEAIIADLQGFSGIHSISDLDIAILQKDDTVIANLVEKARMLSQGIHSLSAILNPEVCLLVTRSKGLSEFLAEKVREFLTDMNRRARSSEHEIDVEVMAVQYDPLLAGRGACDLIFDRFFQVEPMTVTH